MSSHTTEPTDLDMVQELEEDLESYNIDGVGLTTTLCKAALRRAIFAESLLEKVIKTEPSKKNMARLQSIIEDYLSRRDDSD